MKIKMEDFCFEYRDDILFREYVLENNDKKAWKEFCRLPGNTKVSYKKLFKLYDLIKKDGQEVPIFITMKGDQVYPINGATRLGILRSLSVEHVKVKIKKGKTRWNKSFNIDSHHFKGLSDSVMEKFIQFLEKRKLIVPS